MNYVLPLLTKHCSPVPIQIISQRTYRLFRTLGLRFLCVVNHNNQVVGIITRADLLPDSLSDSIMRGRNAHMTQGGAGFS